MPPKRMTANPVKPARYRPGKDTGVESSSDSDDSDAEDEPSKPSVPPPPKAASAGKIASNLGKIDLAAGRKEAQAAESKRLAAQRAEKLAAEEGFVTEEEESEEGAEEDDEDDDDDSESEEEESSEDEAPRRLMIRPKFIPKNQRANQKDPAQLEEEARQAADEARKKAADELIEEQIRKDIAARSAGKNHWDSDDHEDSDVDTTDGIDPEAEEKAWRVREMKRLKRSRDEIEKREAEHAEVDRRRNLTEEERKAEDDAHIARQQEEKDGKGKMSYMQKYFHKGAFFQEETEAAGLLQRDLMGVRIQDDVRNREALPEYLQKRDMTKLGRKGGTKYKDMRSEDTGAWGSFANDGRGGGSSRRFDGGDDRFRPDDDRFKPDERGAKGANTVPLGVRREDKRRDGDRDGGYRSRDGDDHRPRKSRSRSRSPRREEEHGSRRKRSTSRDDPRHDGDKRRRVDARD